MQHKSNSSNTHSKAVARFVSNLRFDDIPDKALERIKILILDTIGCGIFGADLQWSNILFDTLNDIDKYAET